MATFEERWDKIQSEPEFQALPATQKQDLARFYARKVARQEVPGGHKRMRAFIEKNVTGATTRPDTKGAFLEGAREGFDASAIGIIGNAAARKAGLSTKPAGPGTAVSVMDAAENILSGANPLIGEGALRGVAGGVGAMVGQIPDLALGGVMAAGGKKLAMKAGLGALPAEIVGGVGANAVVAGGATKAAGGTNSDAAKAAALAGAMGLLPLAKRVPAGRLNPNVIPPAKPVIKTKPGPGRTPKVDLRNNIDPAARGRAVDAVYPQGPDFPPALPSSRAMVPASGAPGVRPPTVGVMGPSRAPLLGDGPPIAGALPPGSRPVVTPGEVGRAMDLNALRYQQQTPEGAWMMPPADGELGAMARRPAPPEPLALPPGSRPVVTPGEVGVAMQRNAMLDMQTTPDGALMMGPAPTIPKVPGAKRRAPVDAGPIVTVKGGGFGRAARDMSDNEALSAWDRFVAGRGAQLPGYSERGEGLARTLLNRGYHYFDQPEGNIPAGWVKDDPLRGIAEQSTDDLIQHARDLRKNAGISQRTATMQKNRTASQAESKAAKRYKDNGMADYNAADAEFARTRLAAAEAELGRRGVRLGKVPQAPKGEAPKKGAARRLLKEEEGTFNPQAVLDAIDEAIGFTGEYAARAYRAGKGAVVQGARLAAPLTRNVGDLTTIPGRAANRAATAAAGRVGRALGVPAGVDLTKIPEAARQAILREPLTAGPDWLQTAANVPRRYLFSNYNKTPEMLEAWRMSKVDAANLAKPLRTAGLDIDRTRTSADQVDLYDQATDPGYAGRLDPDAARLKGESARVSDEMLRLEALDPEGHARWRGSYLGPREYAKHLRDPQTLLPREVRRGMKGEIRQRGYYGRGLEDTVSPAELAKRLAAGQAWVQVGPAPGGKVRIWRDWTTTERRGWGELRHASRAADRFAGQVETEARAAYFFDRMATPGAADARGEFALPAAGYRAPGRPLPPEVSHNGQRYVLFDSQMAKRGPIKKYGRLADHYVREDVAEFVADAVDTQQLVGEINRIILNNAWKKIATITNVPGYFVNNTMHNIPTLRYFGGSVFDLPEAARMLADDAPLVQQMEAGGWLKNDALARELGGRVLSINKALGSSYYHSGFSVAKSLSRAVDGWRAFETEAYNVAGATDDMFRVALVDGLMRREGKSFDEAVRIADDAFYSPEAITAPVAQWATIPIPFARVLWFQADAMAKTYTTNLPRAGMLTLMASLTPWLINKARGASDEQVEAEKEALPPHMKGDPSLFPLSTGRNLPIGTDAEGQALYLDKSNWDQAGPLAENPHTGLPWPLNMRGLQPGGPLAVVGGLATNVDTFTGKKLAEKVGGQVVSDLRGPYVGRAVTPGVIRNAQTMAGALAGKTTPYGNRVTPGTAAARIAGLKVNPVNVADAADREGTRMNVDMMNFAREINKRRRSAERARANGDEDAAKALEQEAAEIEALLRQAAEESSARQETLQRGTMDGYPIPD